MHNTEFSVHFDELNRGGDLMDCPRDGLLAEFGRSGTVGCPPAHGGVAVLPYWNSRCLSLQVARGPYPRPVSAAPDRAGRHATWPVSQVRRPSTASAFRLAALRLPIMAPDILGRPAVPARLVDDPKMATHSYANPKFTWESRACHGPAPRGVVSGGEIRSRTSSHGSASCSYAIRSAHGARKGPEPKNTHPTTPRA